MPICILVLCLCAVVGYFLPASAAESPSKKTPEKALASVEGPPPNAVRGGTLRAIKFVFPKNLGYAPDQSPVDATFMPPVWDRLVEWDEKGNFVPVLVESWDWNPKTSALTLNLRKGVKFEDDTPFNAEALKFFYTLMLETKTLVGGDAVKSMDVVGEHTLRMHLTDFDNMTIENFVWNSRPFSPTAFKKNGGKEWARLHTVGTGPFKLVSFSRDASMRYERNPGYWRKGYPLLDAIEVRYVPDPVTTQMMLEAKEVDICLETTNMKMAAELEKKGFKVNWGPGMVWGLLPNSADPKSPLNNKKVREAIEYAIDRPALATMLGFGKYEALTQLEPKSSPAYVPNFNPRPYSPEKAKQLLAEAGYPNGFDTKLLIQEKDRDAGVGIVQFLQAVGVRADLDVADPGRYAVSVYSPQATSYPGMVLSWGGVNPDASDLFVHWGTHPMTHRFGQILKSKEYLEVCDRALHTFDRDALKKALQAIVRKASDDAMIVPLYRDGQAAIMQPWVHTDTPRIHRQTWNVYEDWMEKHK